MRISRKLVGWVAGLVAAFAAVGFLAVPPIAKSKLEQALSQALHRPVSVQAVRVNPFVPSLTVRGLAVRERQGDALFAGFDELYVNAAWTSLFRLAPVVDEVTLVKPQVHVVRNADRSYNVQDLIDEIMARPKSDAPPPRFALFNIRLVDGSVDFDDRAEGEKHAVTALDVGIPFISSLAAHADVKVLPQVSANVNGARFVLAGDTLPFSESRATHLKLDLDGFDLTRLADYLPFEPRAKLRSALLDTRLVVVFEQGGRAPQVKLRGAAALRNVALADAQDRPAIAWKRLALELNELEPLAPRIDVKALELDGVELQVRRDKSGALNLAQLGPARSEKASGGGPPLALKVDRLAVKIDKLRFTDETTRPAFETSLEEAQLAATGVDLAKGKRSEWTLAARTEAGEAIRAAAALVADPLGAEGRVDIAGASLKRYQPYVAQASDARIDDGKLDLGLAFSFANGELKLADVALALEAVRLRLPNEKEPFVRIGSLEARGGRADLAARTLALGEVTANELALNVHREKDGILNLSRLARPAKGDEKAGGKPWRIDLTRASLARGALSFEDLALAEPVKVRITPIQLKAERLSTAKGERGNISMRATVDKTGSLAASGTLALEPLSARLRVEARSIGVVPAQRYIDDKVHFAIVSGALSAKGALSLDLPPGGPLKASYRGDLGITDFASIDKRSTQDLLKWKVLSLAALDFELEPMRVSLDEISLSDYYARIILSPEGRLNLQDLVVASESPPAPAPAGTEKSLPPNVRIGKIALAGGNVNFSDFFIKPNYSADLAGVGGTVTEMTPDKAGEVDLRGKLDNAAPVEILGRVNPLGANLFLDMKAAATDIELPPLSAYSVKYAGYNIQRGKLSLKVKYLIENRKLSAENQIYLDQLTFGERVESPTATKLPLTLAIALLKDRKGVIDINLPISGSLDDPQFSLGGVIVKVVVNLIVKAVTAPFALLGSLFGGGGEELAYVEFAPGSAALAAAEAPKLKKLATALTERPGLKLDIAGRAAPDADREGLRHAAIDAKVRAQKFNDLRRAGDAPASVAAVKVEPAEYEKYLRRAYGEEKFAKPRNMIGLAKDLPVPEMEKLMLEHTQVADDELRMLANERAQSAKEWLITQGKVPAERVFVVAPKLTAEGIEDKGSATRADFGLK